MRSAKGKRSVFFKLIGIVYLLSLMVFEGMLLALNILPSKIMLVLAIVLLVISIILVIQLFSRRVKKWARMTSVVTSVFLIFIFVVGSAFAHSTLTFFGKTTAEKKNKDALNVVDKPFNVYISGIDQFGDIKNKGRSDVNMIATINPKTNKILLTSIPRDYQIRQMKHGKSLDKLTHTGLFGIDDSILAVEDLLDININYYAKINFATVAVFIDQIGGLDINSDYEFSTRGYIDDQCHERKFHFKKGKNHVDGWGALAFARERYAFKDGDNQRIKNQQIVFEALLKKIMSSKAMLFRYNKIMKGMPYYFKTNFTSDEIKSLIKMQLNKGNSWKFERASLEGHDAIMDTFSGNRLYVMAKDEKSIKEIHAQIDKVMYPEKYKVKKKDKKTSDSETEEEAED